MKMAESRKSRAPFIALFAMSGRSDEIVAPNGANVHASPPKPQKALSWMGHNPSREKQE